MLPWGTRWLATMSYFPHQILRQSYLSVKEHVWYRRKRGMSESTSFATVVLLRSVNIQVAPVSIFRIFIFLTSNLILFALQGMETLVDVHK